MLRVGLDNENRVIGIAQVGGFENDIEMNESEIPKDAHENPFLYKFINGEFIKDEDKFKRQQLQAEIEDIKAEFDLIDNKTARSARGIIRAFIQDRTPNLEDIERVIAADARSEELRSLLEEKSNLIKALPKG